MEDTKSNGGNKYLIGGAILVSAIILFFLASAEGYTPSIIDPQVGPDDATVLIEEFSDFQCPACKQSAPLISGALEQFPDSVKFVYKDFPLSIHDKARPAAAAVLCAAQQDKFKEFHDIVFANQETWSGHSSDPARDYFAEFASQLNLDLDEFDTCRESRDIRKLVQADMAEGLERGVNSTPSFFINGKKIDSNPTSVFGWIKLIEEELESQGIIIDSDDTSGDTGESSDSAESIE
jgi:protein-disulfide isomerase